MHVVWVEGAPLFPAPSRRRRGVDGKEEEPASANRQATGTARRRSSPCRRTTVSCALEVPSFRVPPRWIEHPSPL